ncbi:hypothetical protein ROHU_031193 [Labeo rohita]|uniref:Uncharacterized protein n=1 Tax=Labeo rohita TaxID=84645 RepID=A0A498LQ79_LABRO|nr:hypothetical protein ROHU_011095 [Labeo rohita]RXN09813.1 hypothetical protein ROHU_031193 [Labeo rohita]
MLRVNSQPVSPRSDPAGQAPGEGSPCGAALRRRAGKARRAIRVRPSRIVIISVIYVPFFSWSESSSEGLWTLGAVLRTDAHVTPRLRILPLR